MAYEVKDPILQFVDHWQTLIAGLLALFAAVCTIVVTIISANREVSTAQKQIKVTPDQMEAMLRIERRRLALESYAFLAILQATINIVIEDVKAARDIFGEYNQGAGTSPDAYKVRRRVKKTGFADLRSACLRTGASLTEPFLRLDKEIDDLAEQVTKIPSALREDIPMGCNAGLREHLDRIESQARSLRTEAENEMERCNKVLVETPTPPVALTPLR